jgi:hypothetical protein
VGGVHGVMMVRTTPTRPQVLENAIVEDFIHLPIDCVIKGRGKGRRTHFILGL